MMEPQIPLPTYSDRIQQPLADEVPWSSRDAWMGVLFLGGWIVFELLLSLFLLLVKQDAQSGWILALSESVLMIPVWWLAFHRRRASWKDLGFRSFKWKDLQITFVLLAGLYVFMLIYGVLLSLLHLEPDVDWVEVFQSQSSPALLILVAVIIAPLLEEIIFRGFIFPGFSKKYGWKVSLLLTAGMFAVLHFQIVNLVLYFVLGCVLAYLRYVSKSIWPSILVHFLVNGISVILTYVMIAAPLG